MSGKVEPKVPEPSGVRLALTLGVAGLISGLALVTTYETTLPIIEENDRRALREAVKGVVPGSERMQKLVSKDGKMVPAAENDPSPGVYAGYAADGSFRGYAIVGEGPGFQDVIRVIFGFDPDQRQLTGMYVLDSRETPGLGDKIYKDLVFVGAFEKLKVEPEIVATKKGTSQKPNEVDVITGATISAKAVVKIINVATQAWMEGLPRSSEVPPLEEPKPVASTQEPSP